MCYEWHVASDEDLKDSATSRRPEADVHRDRLVALRACIAAAWADGSMAAVERDFLDHLVGQVALTARERERLRRAVLADVNPHQVLEEVADLPPTARRELFDSCTELVTRDRRLRRPERRLLGRLRRRCGVGWWEWQRTLLRSSRGRRWRLALLLVAAVAAAVVLGLTDGERPALVPPREGQRRPELLLPSAPDTDPLSPAPAAEELYEAVRRSVVQVVVRVDERRVRSGSGAVIGIDAGRSSYYVVTNRHVIYLERPPEQELSFDVEFENGARFASSLDFYSRRDDLALLAVHGTPLWAAPVPLRRRSDLRVGERVYALGNPMGLRHTFTSGMISALRPQALQTDATVHSGSSGGPLFDARGLLCGVVTTSHVAKDLSFALYADAILAMLDERRSAG